MKTKQEAETMRIKKEIKMMHIKGNNKAQNNLTLK
jgi:hypothetical protein